MHGLTANFDKILTIANKSLINLLKTVFCKDCLRKTGLCCANILQITSIDIRNWFLKSLKAIFKKVLPGLQILSYYLPLNLNLYKSITWF